jgi:hypothetical protein
MTTWVASDSESAHCRQQVGFVKTHGDETSLSTDTISTLPPNRI